MASLTDVLECHHVTGEDCYVMKVAVASVRELEGLLERLLKFGNTTTSIVVSSPVTGRIIGPPQRATISVGIGVFKRPMSE